MKNKDLSVGEKLFNAVEIASCGEDDHETAKDTFRIALERYENDIGTPEERKVRMEWSLGQLEIIYKILREHFGSKFVPHAGERILPHVKICSDMLAIELRLEFLKQRYKKVLTDAGYIKTGKQRNKKVLTNAGYIKMGDQIINKILTDAGYIKTGKQK